MKKKICVFLLTILLCSTLASIAVQSVSAETPKLLSPQLIPKWINQLEKPPPTYNPNNITDNSGKLVRQEYVVKIREFKQQLLPTIDSSGNPTGFGATKIWGFEGEARDAITGENLGLVRSTPGCTFEAIRGVPVQVKWINDLVDSNGNPLPNLFAVDPTLHWANPNGVDMPNPNSAPIVPIGYRQAQSPVPIVIHLHGEVSSSSDGNPEAWWTANGLHGTAYRTVLPTDSNSAVFDYPNEQQATTLWYHDHALGITRLNVMSGLAGFYLLRDTEDPIEDLLPNDEFEIPLTIQDRSFLPDGQLFFPSQGNNATVHPYWNPTFVGNTFMVNGLVWPNMDVKQGQYRLRILDGSNSRFYSLHFSNNISFTQIGSDGGDLEEPVSLTSLKISPGERVDLLIDFSNISPGEKIVLQNLDPTFTTNDEKETVGQIIQFTIVDKKGHLPQSLPSDLNPTLSGNFPTLPSPTKNRTFTLVEQGNPISPVTLLLDGQQWDAPVSEKPELGTTEDWTIVNPTMDTHPIHLHLVQFQLVERQTLASIRYMSDWTALNGNLPLNHSSINVASLDKYLVDRPIKPAPNEKCWKDTIQAEAGEVTVIRIRFAPQDASNYKFDPTSGPGYVWHCHILEHEDNEMMRPYVVVTSNNQMALLLAVSLIAVIISVIIGGLIFLRHFRRPNK
jgi:spore coat protein A, manganese oxidase